MNHQHNPETCTNPDSKFYCELKSLIIYVLSAPPKSRSPTKALTTKIFCTPNRERIVYLADSKEWFYLTGAGVREQIWVAEQTPMPRTATHNRVVELGNGEYVMYFAGRQEWFHVKEDGECEEISTEGLKWWCVGNE